MKIKKSTQPLSAAFNQDLAVITFLNKASFDNICSNTDKRAFSLLARAAPDDTIIAAFLSDGRMAGFASYADDGAFRNAGLIEVDHALRDRGIATRLLRAAMSDAARDDMTVRFSYFTEMGCEILTELLPRLHREFPDLRVQYLGCPETFTGSKPYRAPIPSFEL